jgi:hypothetical protein
MLGLPLGVFREIIRSRDTLDLVPTHAPTQSGTGCRNKVTIVVPPAKFSILVVALIDLII